MIEIKNKIHDEPYRILYKKYEFAIENKQIMPEAISISSYNSVSGEVNSRFVNIKVIDGENFIFFTNYNSKKASEFNNHSQISAIFYWQSINTQIRFKGIIKKTSKTYNQNYFQNRSIEKNALAISSMQSNPIKSYDEIKRKYHDVYKSSNLKTCPNYWGGYSFKPYEIEFWEGNEFRLNKRNFYKKNKTTWNHFILEP